MSEGEEEDLQEGMHRYVNCSRHSKKCYPLDDIYMNFFPCMCYILIAGAEGAEGHGNQEAWLRKVIGCSN